MGVARQKADGKPSGRVQHLRFDVYGR